MKKLVLLFLMFFLAITVYADSQPVAPVLEKEVQSFVLDVGVTPMSRIITYESICPADPVNFYTLNLVYYGCKKIRYDTILKNKSDNGIYKEAVTVGDSVPIAA